MRLPALAMLVALLPMSARAQQSAAAEDPCAATLRNEWTMGAVAWTQASGEWRALSYQAFALARRIVDDDLRHGRRRPPRAVVVDVDETVLDNAPFQASLIASGRPFSPAAWSSWASSARAEAMPGAVEFLRYAASRGLTVFYVTNRSAAQREATTANLVAAGFPGVGERTLLMREGDAGKEPRRRAIAADHRIVLLVGDSLNDLHADFEATNPQDRKAAVDRRRADFGTRFVVLPNPVYGPWEDALHADAPAGSDRRANRLRALRPSRP